MSIFMVVSPAADYGSGSKVTVKFYIKNLNLDVEFLMDIR